MPREPESSCGPSPPRCRLASSRSRQPPRSSPASSSAGSGVDQGKPVALILIAFVVPLQAVASMLGFLARDGAAGTGMGILAGTWLSVALVTLAGRPGATSDALGLLLLVASVAMLVPASAALRGQTGTRGGAVHHRRFGSS